MLLAKETSATSTGGIQVFVHPLSSGIPFEGQKLTIINEWKAELQPVSAQCHSSLSTSAFLAEPHSRTL